MYNVTKILLVDDDISGEATGLLLRRRGYSVRTCATLAEAVENLSSDQFNLLISDIRLPDGSGIDLVRWARARFPMRAIALSGLGAPQDIQRSMSSGFDVHLIKPANIRQLERTINTLLSSA